MDVTVYLLFRTVLETLFICCIAALYLSILGGVKTLLKLFSSPRARALRALGLLLADGAPTVGGGKTF